MTVSEAIQFLKAQGYCVTVPEVAATPRASGWAPPIGAYKPAMKKWRLGHFTVKFKDGWTVTGAALHDGKRWQVGSAAHAACDRYRYLSQRQLEASAEAMRADIAAIGDDVLDPARIAACERYSARLASAAKPIDGFRVASIAAIDIDGESFDAAMVNRETAEYRQPGANRFGRGELATPKTKITREQRDFWRAHFAERKAAVDARG